MDSSNLPRKVSGLVTQTVDDEVLVHLPGNPRVLLLDKFTSDVMHLCDGETSTENIARALNSSPGDAEMALLRLQKSALISTGTGQITRRHILGSTVAIPFLLTVGLSVPAAAQSGCAANCGATTPSSCTSINEPPAFPPTGCSSCCGTCGFFGTSCPSCPADCAACSCMLSINVVGGAGGSCGTTDTLASGSQSCVRDMDPACTPSGACQRDCAAARAAAIAGGVTQYACCTNCT